MEITETMSEAGIDQAEASSQTHSELPVTLYRQHVIDCTNPDNSFVFDFMSDYLTMMDVLAKSIMRELSNSCNITPLQYRIMLRMLVCDHVTTHELSKDLRLGASTISTAISKLAARGAVVRAEDINDMRTVFLSLSEKGRKIVDIADEAIFANMQTYWGSLTREQFDAASKSSYFAASRHSCLRYEDGKLRLDTALMDTVMISRTLTSQALQAYGLSIGDFRVMLALKIIGESDTTSNVAQFLFLNSSDITSSLKNLDARGYLKRARSDSNRRIRSVALTESGLEELNSLMPVVFDALHETCHSDDELIKLHISSARNLVARRRMRSEY